jgi:hypothetical protein
MVNVNTTVVTPGQRQREKVARIRTLQQRPGLRVEPASDDMRRLLMHPRAGGFRSEGSIEWPDDTFTHRRLRDGSVKLAEQKEEKHDEAKAPAHAHHASTGSKRA